MFTALKGIAVGGSMLLPGLSGGTMAILLGIYDKLLGAISGLLKRKTMLSSFIYLIKFCIGAVVGFIVFSLTLGKVIPLAPAYFHSFCIGAVAGTLPLLLKNSNPEHKFQTPNSLLLIIGVTIGVGVMMIPAGLFDIGDSITLLQMLIIFAGGVFIAVALILPGISVSYTLLILGLYDKLIIEKQFFNMPLILPLAIGAVVGTFGFSKLLENRLAKFPCETYSLITGFVMLSMAQVFIDTQKEFAETAADLLAFVICIVLGGIGFIATFMLSKLEK